MGSVRMKEGVSSRKCCSFLCIQACWSVVCRIWPPSYWDLLEELVEWLYVPATHEYKSRSMKTSIPMFDSPPSNDTCCPATTGVSSNPKAADETDSNEGYGDGAPKWVEEEGEAGVYTMRVCFRGGAKKSFKRVQFSQEWLKRHAEKWWDANKARVCQRYDASEAELLKDKVVSLPRVVEVNPKLVGIGSSKGSSQQQVEQWWDANKSSLSERYNIADSLRDHGIVCRAEWVEQDEPGVYMSTMGGVNFVRFSPTRFCGKQAGEWWDAKTAGVLERCNILDVDIHLVEWVEWYETGVFVRLVSFSGRANKDIMRVFFSPKVFNGKLAQQWWAANKSSLYQHYDLPLEGGGVEAEWVELDSGGGFYVKPLRVPVPGTPGLLVYIKPVSAPPPAVRDVYL